MDKIRTKESKKVRFLPRTSDSSVEGKSKKSTLKYIGDCCIQFGKGNIYPLILKKKDHYAQEALTHKVKYVRLIRKTIRRKRRYFAQLILEGTPPKTKHLKYGKRDQRVGLDEGTSTIAIVTQNEVSLIFCTAEDLKHIDRDLCIRNYQKFKRLHDQEVERLRKENKKALRWYIA